MIHRTIYKLVATLACAAATAAALAQPVEPRAPREERSVIIGDRAAAPVPPPSNEIDLRRAFAPVARSTTKSVAGILIKGEQVALGTIVSADGYIITKASEISFPCSVRLPGGRIVSAKLIGTASEHDLALLKVDSVNLTPARILTGDDIAAGKWMASVGTSELPLAVGVVSVGRRVIPAEAIIGVFLADSDVADGETAGARVMRVDPHGNAAKAGVRGGDVIVKIGDEPVVQRDDVLTALSRHKPGDEVAIVVSRADEQVALKVTLAKRLPPSTRSVRQNSMGSRLSNRRSGFAAVIQHDAVNLQPKDCGSPLIDLDGNVVAINIARAGRTETYAVPAAVVANVVEELKRAEVDNESTISSDEKPETEAELPTTRPAQ